MEMEDKHAIAERLENRRVTLYRLCLSGIALGGGARLLQAYAFASASLVLTVLQVLGAVILLASLLQLWSVYRTIRKDRGLQEVLNDELAVQTQLKSRQAGFFVLLALQLLLLPIAYFYPLNSQLVLELGLFLGVVAVLGMRVVQEELLVIARFRMTLDEDRFEVWNWRKPSFFPYIINPGLAVNELLLGQRVPKVMLIDKQSPRPLAERSYVPCPSCGTIHKGNVWSAQHKTAFKNWYGLYCPHCGETIPCLRNITSWLILMLTYPFWFWKKETREAKWLEKQKQRFQNLPDEPVELDKSVWWKMGVRFGLVMFVLMTFVLKTITLLFDEVEGDLWSYYFDLEFLLVSAIGWAVGGALFGLIMWLILGKKGTGVAKETEGQAS
ncbi:MAG TPA: hypothetical protein DCE41_29085 [Cytophagales bacterium]|nr:hypothetical protein [Cytophagales bacterium]